MSAHIVWDWNGTLLHDVEAVLDATNASFAEVGMAPITMERYRELYCVPVPHFYRRLIGRMPTQREWEVLDAAFHRHYWARVEACDLAEGVTELLTGWSAAGRTQSILSMSPHAHLVPLVRRYGVESHFVRIQGNPGANGGGKSEHMVRHLRQLREEDGLAFRPEQVVVIGDASDDARAALAAGARAVLYTGGSHSRSALEEVGVPVVDTLAEAVSVALDQISS
ncbi:HAD family hydrolase [Allostreptomyces psammosilenae]|uniref:Phosphoglycolate phosphatase-like HAD superfamily hydrolase n=1 Tax=Allostreptomyces psammosilenae TaxID=1892865 RepID=A0A852ZY77_9ACTN|nr:HAD family hydrolase [Allostreptomyces psammosilenae]NYI06190.1 phosphoglycolate phosphatase-like HAD superfamily hydrolase [Allostreptomyces psammosilenae]